MVVHNTVIRGHFLMHATDYTCHNQLIIFLSFVFILSIGIGGGGGSRFYGWY